MEVLTDVLISGGLGMSMWRRWSSGVIRKGFFFIPKRQTGSQNALPGCWCLWGELHNCLKQRPEQRSGVICIKDRWSSSSFWLHIWGEKRAPCRRRQAGIGSVTCSWEHPTVQSPRQTRAPSPWRSWTIVTWATQLSSLWRVVGKGTTFCFWPTVCSDWVGTGQL